MSRCRGYIPEVSDADVQRIIERDYPAADHEKIILMFYDYADGADAGGSRVLVAILKLAGGRTEQLQKHLDVARIDWRDVLMLAERDPTEHRRWLSAGSAAPNYNLRPKSLGPGRSLPPLLDRLLERGLWKHSGEEVMLRAVPFITDPMIFLESRDEMDRESGSLMISLDVELPVFFVYRGSVVWPPRDLPWVDADRAILITVCAQHGTDVALALDYRTDPMNPRVIGTDWHSVPFACAWREASPSFSEFCNAIGLPTDLT